jgi:hypothetical protein
MVEYLPVMCCCSRNWSPRPSVASASNNKQQSSEIGRRAAHIDRRAVDRFPEGSSDKDNSARRHLRTARETQQHDAAQQNRVQTRKKNEHERCRATRSTGQRRVDRKMRCGIEEVRVRSDTGFVVKRESGHQACAPFLIPINCPALHENARVGWEERLCLGGGSSDVGGVGPTCAKMLGSRSWICGVELAPARRVAGSNGSALRVDSMGKTERGG